MKTDIRNATNVRELIKARLQLQSTQRSLLSIFGVKTSTIEYLESSSFRAKFSEFSDFKKKSFCKLIAGNFAWISAKELLS